jgi:predicted RND superfamily exporter protein
VHPPSASLLRWRCTGVCAVGVAAPAGPLRARAAGCLFLLTGSVVLPLKALLLNVLSLTAAFGALVWIFQDGHLGAFGTTATGTLVASVPVLLFCLAFGLSMDYEVFLISRIRESWLATGKTRADNDESVALGLARTGRVVTAAALLMAVTFASLVAADVSVMRIFGVGVPLAVLVDATLVRMLLMPAFMRVLGRVSACTAGPAASAVRHQRIFCLGRGCTTRTPRKRSGCHGCGEPCRSSSLCKMACVLKTQRFPQHR